MMNNKALFFAFNIGLFSCSSWGMMAPWSVAKQGLLSSVVFPQYNMRRIVSATSPEPSQHENKNIESMQQKMSPRPVLISPLLTNKDNQDNSCDPLGDGISSVRLVGVGGSDLSVVNAARTSFNSLSEKIKIKDVELLKKLIREGHKTPFEQTFSQYHVSAPLFVIRQWMRHRIGVSYNEQSARYTTMEQKFYIPKQLLAVQDLHNDENLKKEYKKVISIASAVYDLLIKAGVPRERARGILPVCLYSIFYFGCNLNSLFHFVELRADSHAQWETQQYAKAMLKQSFTHFPYSVGFWSQIKCPQLAQELGINKELEKHLERLKK
jgi:thymidylate synthase (FAD)